MTAQPEKPESLWKPPTFDTHPGAPLRGRRRGICDKVLDGDTLDVWLEMGVDVYRFSRIRVLKVDTPEMHSTDPVAEALAHQAHDATAALCLNKPVMLDLHSEQQVQGRLLADVYYYDPLAGVGIGPWRNLADYLIANHLTKTDVPKAL